MHLREIIQNKVVQKENQERNLILTEVLSTSKVHN